MKRFLIRIKMFNKTEIDIFVDSNSIETVMGFLEQEFIDNIQPMLTVHDVYKIVHMINKSKIHQITVAEKPNVIYTEETMVLGNARKSSQEDYGNYS